MSPKVEAWNGNNAGAGDLGDIQDEERPLPKLQPVDEIYGRKNSVPATKSSEASEAPEEVKNILPARKSAESQSLSEAPEEVKNSLTASLSIESVDENAQVRSWQSHEKAMKDKHDFDKQYKNFTSLDADNLMPHLKENQENARTRSWSAREFEMQKQQIQKQYDDFDKDDSPKKTKANDFNTDFGKAFEEYEQQRKLTMENITKNKEESKKKPEDDKEGRKHQEEKGNKAEMEEEADNEYQEYLRLLESNAPSREDDKKYEGYVKAVDSDNEPEPVAPVNSTLTSEKSLKNTSNVAAPLEDKGAIDSKASSSSADKPNVEKSSLESSEKAMSDSPTNSSSPKQNPDLSSSAVSNGTAVVEPSAASLIDKNPNVESHSSATDTKANTEPSPAPAASAANEKPIPPPSGNATLNSVESISPKASDKPNNLEDSSALVSHEKPTTELSFGPTAKLDDSSIQAIKTGVDQLMPLLNGSIPVTEKKAGDITSALLSTNKTINDLRLIKQEEGAMKKSNNSTVSANKRHELRPNRNYKLRTEEDNAVSEGKSTIGAEHINVVDKAMNPVESLSAEPDTEGGFDKRVQTPNDLDHTEGGGEHVINNVVKIEEEEQARKRAENDKYDLYKRLQHGFKTDENSKPPNIYVDNRVFIYDGEKSKTEQPYVRGKPGKAGGKGVSAKTYIIDREMKVANDPRVGRVIITTKEPVKKTLDAKDPEDKVVAGPAVSHEEEQIKDAVNEEAKALKNNEDTGKLPEDNGLPAINASESKFQNEANATNELSEANAKSETISEGEKKEAAAEVKRKPKLITLPAPHNFIIPETKKFSNAMKNLSALENLAQKEPPNLVRDMVSAKGKPANFDSYGGDTVTKSKILPYSGARYHMANPDAVTAATYVNEIDDLSHGASIAPSPIHTQQKNGLPKERQNALTDMGNNKQDSKAEGTPILIYFTRDKNANVPAIAETHDASSTPSPSKILKNVNKFAKLEKSIIKSMNGKPAQTPILPELTTSGLRAEVTARNFTSEPEPAPMFKSNIKSEIKTVSSVTTKAQVDCCSTVLKKDRAPSEPPQPVKPMANLTIDEVPGVEKNTITGESKYTSPINQENLPGANVVSGGDEGSNAEGDPVTIDMQGIHNPISQIASGMQDMIAQAQSSMGNVPGLTNKTKNAESGNGTNDGTNQAREVIPREPADNAEKVQDPPKQINAEKLPFVEKRFQIPTKITKASNCEEKPGKRSHFRKSWLKRSCIQSTGTRKSTTPHKHSPSHKITRRENKEDDLMSFYKSPDLSKENERDDTNSPFASINNPELLEDLVDASRNADISQMRNFHVPTAESIITMPELHVLNLINRSLNTVFNIQTSQLGGTRINNDTRYPITKKQIIKIIRSIEKLHSPKLDENSPSLNYKKISQMAFSTFQKFLARHNASASLLQGDEFPKVQGRYGGGIASERSRDLISEKRLQFGGSRSRKFRQMLLDDIVPNVEKRSGVLRNEEAIQKEGSLKNNSVSENEKTKRELIPSRVGALQPSNLKPLPPVGHDPDEQPFQAVPDALETPSVQPNSSKQQQQQQQQQKQQHNADSTNEEKVDETLAEKNREALKSYEEQKAKEEKKESTMETEAPEDQALKNNPSGPMTKPQAMSAGTEKAQAMANTDTPQPFRFNWTKLEEEKLLQLQKQLAMSQNASRDTHGPYQQLKQQQNLTGPVEAPAGLNLPSSTASLQNDKQGVNATSQHQFDDDHEVQNSPHNSNNNNKNNNNNNNNNNGGETHPFEAKMNNSLIASMEERRRNESADANKNKVLHETDPVIHENDKQSEGDGEGSHVTGESQHNKGNPYENKAELDKNKNVNGQEAQPEQSPPVGEDGKPHADSGPQEHKINEAKAKAPLEPPANATAPDVGETDKGEIGSGGVTSVAKKLKPIQTKPDKTYQDIDTTFEAGLREEEKAREAKAIKMRNNAHQKILSSNNNNNNDDNNINNNNNNNSSISNSIKNNNSLNSVSNKISSQKEGNEMKNGNSAPENNSQGEQTVSNDGSKVFHQSRKISFNPENKTQPSSMLITSDATYGPRQNQTKLQIDINPRNSANESTAAAKADAREREIKEMKESLEDLVKQQHTNSKYPHLKLPTKNGDYIGPLDIFDDLGSQPTTSTTSAAAVKSKGTYDDTAINTGEERKANNDGGPRLQPTRSTQTTTRKQPKIGRINHNYDDDEEFQNIIDSTPTESGGKKTTQTLKQKTTPVLPSKVKEETRKMRENPATLTDNKAENGGLNWTMVQELLKKEAQAKEASKANKNEGDNNGDYVPLLANTSDGKSIPLIPIPMDSPLGKLLYPALGQKDSDAATQQTKSNVNNVTPNFANNDDLDLSSLLLESPSKPFNKRAGSAPQNLQNALINKLLQDAKLKAQYTENPLEIAKSQQNKKEVVLLPDKRGLIIAKSNYLSDLGKPMKNTFSVGFNPSKLNTFKDRIPEVIPKLTSGSSYIGESSGNGNAVPVEDNKDNNDGQIHITVQKKNGQLLLIPDQKEALERQMVPQSIKLDLQYKVTQLQKKDQIHSPFHYQTKTFENNDISLRDYSLQKKDLIFSHRKSRAVHRRRRRKNVERHSVRTHSRGWREGEKT